MYQKDMAYRIYVTDEIYENARGGSHEIRFRDILKSPVKETKSGEEIAQEIIEKAGLIYESI